MEGKQWEAYHFIPIFQFALRKSIQKLDAHKKMNSNEGQ